jgi:hypothetical protein
MTVLRDLPDGRRLVDSATLSGFLKVTPRTIRRHCPAVACDRVTRRRLYDLDEVMQLMSNVRARPGRNRRAYALPCG